MQGEFRLQGGQHPIRRVDEEQLVGGAGASVRGNPTAAVLPAHLAAVAVSESLDVRPQRAQGPRGGLAENPVGGPRDSASSPSAPLPANASSTRSPPTSPTIENSDPRRRSDVGRVPRPGGASSGTPLRSPATILTPAGS